MLIDVIGLPAPQGSKRHVGHGILVESSKKVKPWRQDVKWAAIEVIREHLALDAGYTTMARDVWINIDFRLARPKGHYRTGRNAGTLRDSAPTHPGHRPDLDKLIRSTFDALGEAGVWLDDSQVVQVIARKMYADDAPPGATILVYTPARYAA